MVKHIASEASNDIAVPSEITVKEAGRRGGNVTRDRYASTGFYQRIGQKGGKKTAELFGDLLREFAKRGGRPQRPALNMGEGDHNQKEAGRPSGPPSPA